MKTKNINCPTIQAIGNIIGGFNLENGPWVAGGNARRLWYDLDCEKYDFDIFFANNDSFENAIKSMKTLQDGKKRNKICTINFDSKNAISININGKSINNDLPYIINVQAIRLNSYKTMQDMFNDFDITICKFATDGFTVMADDDALKDCESNIIRRNYPYQRKLKLARIAKYAFYGFNPDVSIMKELYRQYKEHDTELDDEY